MRDNVIPEDAELAGESAGLDSFSAIEQRIVDFGRRHPDMPLRQVIASRLVHYLFGCIENASDTLLQPYGLTTTTWISLVVIYARGPGSEVKPSDLSHAIGASRAHVTRIVDFLVSRGWVARRASSEDRRVSLLALTAEGERHVERILPAMFGFNEALWAGIPEQERDSFVRVARRLAARAASLPGVPAAAGEGES